MKLKPFKEIIAMSKEKLDEALAPIRARQVKMQAELEVAKLDEKLVSLEAKVQELCAVKQIDFDAVIKALDEHGLAERRKKQLNKIVQELFPE